MTQATINVEGEEAKVRALEALILAVFGKTLVIEVDYRRD